MINYELMVNDSVHSIVLLKEPLNKTIDTGKLVVIADSLFNNKPHNSSIWHGYSVWFYYRKDWKGHEYYAAKQWLENNKHPDSLDSQSLDVTGTTGNDKQDEINTETMIAANKAADNGSIHFDTLAYLTKIKSYSTKKIKQLVKMQLDKGGEVKSFIELCKNKLDSAGIKVEGEVSYSHLYYHHFIKVWGSASHPLIGNGITLSQIVTFEGAYDILGNQVYFKSSLNKPNK